MKFPSIGDMVQTIVAAHKAVLMLPVPEHPVPLNSESDVKHPVYAAALEAALALGFIAPDARCIATAWQNQAAREGEFDAAKWPARPQDFGLLPWPRDQAFPPCPKNLGLYAVLPDAQWVARMAQAGVPTLQLRFKSSDPVEIARQVRQAVDAVKGSDSLLFINDHWQAAIDAGAYGVHLGQEDLEAVDGANLSAIHRSGLRLGLSSHGYAEMLKADRVSPSYIAMGAVYATTLKRMVTPPQGPGRLAAYARLMRDYPLVAIGGIDEARFDDVLASGVGSVAVVRAIVAAEDPEATATRLMRKIPTQSTL
jgi:thiamine-phosphate pyrophosphorylase